MRFHQEDDWEHGLQLEEEGARKEAVTTTHMFASVTGAVSLSTNITAFQHLHRSVQTADWHQLSFGVASALRGSIGQILVVCSADGR